MSRTAWVLAFAALALGILWWLSQKSQDRLESPREPKENEPPRRREPTAGRARLSANRPATNGHPEHADPTEVRTAINRANAECLAALEAGDAHGYAQHFADDSISLPGRGPMVRGRVAIEEAMEEAFTKVRFSEAEWETLETRFNGKTAYETGAYKFVVRPAGRGPAQKMTGRYFVVWKKVGDEWKIAVDAAQPGAPAE